MNPQTVFCPNQDCPARGQTDQDNIRIHSRKEKRYRCTLCKRTFSERASTPFYWCHTDEATIVCVLTLLSFGCPTMAIEAAFGFDRRTVRAWLKKAGTHGERLHQERVVQRRRLLQVQADELRIKIQNRILWMATAIEVQTRLFLGGFVSESRDRSLIDQLAVRIRACALEGPMLLVTDGLKTYINAFKRAFREKVRTGKVGRPAFRPWRGLVIGQVVKRYERRRVKGVEHRLIEGFNNLKKRLIGRSQTGHGVLNTAYIERLNATFRSHMSGLVRRTRSLWRKQEMVEAGMHLFGCIYNFCLPHASLRLADGTARTPAMAAGLTDQVWTIEGLLHYRVAPPRWQPPKRRGRPSRQMQQLIERWAA